MKARDNPFRTERLDSIRYRFCGFTRDDLLSRLERLEYRGALVGPEGSGKTTLLENLAGALEAKGRQVRLVRAAAGLMPMMVHRDEILFVDSAERLSAAEWWFFWRQVRRAGGLVITMRHAGRLPTLARLATTPALLAELVSELAGEAYSSAAAERLYGMYRGNLRAALLHMYDECALQTSSFSAPGR